jgi:hypothetical protein
MTKKRVTEKGTRIMGRQAGSETHSCFVCITVA